MESLDSPLLRMRIGAPETITLDAAGDGVELSGDGRESAGVVRESAALVELARGRQARTIAIGFGRDAGVRDTVRVLADGWEAQGGEAVLELSWPEVAASWLRQATRFAAADPDLWIMFGPPLGWAQMTRRLLWSTPWDPARTLLSGALSDRRVLDLVGLHNLSGIAGVTRDGSRWELGGGRGFGL
ncbi:hypothetical protein [Kribbella solani]|uniref:Uncharacterized protein n=1 Tax=Kribbella solani TaxID=236067 RepID=A0A841DX22_9ACTN|nr:hypothetical protein [Kribbella solani]MBB5983704.1 hypothetical protein [Kribbella solani]